MKTFIEFIYAAFIGVAVALFVGFGIWAFYQGPQYPDYPTPIYSPTGELTENQIQEQKEYEKRSEDYHKQEKAYSQNVAMVALVPAVLFYIGGMIWIKRNEVLGEGLAFGGIFTSLYALMRSATGTTAANRVVVFVSVTVSLLMLVFLAQQKFRPEKPAKKR